MPLIPECESELEKVCLGLNSLKDVLTGLDNRTKVRHALFKTLSAVSSLCRNLNEKDVADGLHEVMFEELKPGMKPEMSSAS